MNKFSLGDQYLVHIFLRLLYTWYLVYFFFFACCFGRKIIKCVSFFVCSPFSIIPFRTAVPFWGQITLILSSMYPKRDRGSDRGNRRVVMNERKTHFHLTIFKAAVPFSGQTTETWSGLSPKRHCGSKTFG